MKLTLEIALIALALTDPVACTFNTMEAHMRPICDIALEARATPCPTEDSDNCHWHAQSMGNGGGFDFTAIATENDAGEAVSVLFYETGEVEIYEH